MKQYSFSTPAPCSEESQTRTWRGLVTNIVSIFNLKPLALLLLLLPLGISSAWAARSAKVTTAVTPAGSGYAYISTTQTIGTDTEATQSSNSNNSDRIFYIKAVAASGYVFDHWEFVNASGTTSITSSTSAETSITVQTAGSNYSTRNNTIRAVFQQVEGFVGYVIYDGNDHYLNGTEGTTSLQTFRPSSCIWTLTGDNKFSNSGNYVRLTRSGYYNNYTYSLNISNTNSRNTITLSGTESGTTGQKIQVAYDNDNKRYIRYNSGWTVTNTSTDNGTNVVFSVIKRDHDGVDNTTAPTISAAINPTNAGIQFSHTNVSGTYAPAYTDYIFYNNTHHYWYNDATHNSAPSQVSNWSNATYTWSITSGGDYALINATTGLLTSKGVATTPQNVTVTLTTTEANSGYTNTQTYTVQIQDHAATSNTVISNPNVEPEYGADLDYNESATYTASATATKTDIAAYTQYSFNSQTYWCIAGNSTRYSSESACISAATTITYPEITYTWSLWSLTGEGNAYLSKTDNGASTTVTHSPQNITSTDYFSLLRVTASANGQSATSANPIQITARYPHIDPTAVTITSANPMMVHVGDTGTINYTLSPFPCFENVRCDISVAGIINLVIQESGVVKVTGLSRGGCDVTITARNQDDTDGPSAIVHINVHEQIATPVITFAPTESDNGNTASTTITCSTPNAQIYYTTDGTTPTTSSTLYNGAFSVNDEGVVKAFAVMPSSVTDYEYYDNSEVAEKQYFSCYSAQPTILISGNEVTFSSTDDNVVFYYTTDGTTPTTSSTRWNGNPITTLSNETIIKVIAKTGNCISSDVVSRIFISASGISGGVVTLNDLEDHNWTYYAGVSSDVDGGNYNTNYAGKLYSPDPRNVKITYKGNGQLANGTAVTGVKVGIDADASTFVYYKTIEHNNGYKYTTIPNPFSVRPKIGNTYYGFSAWKVTSVTGGTITGKAVGSTINAETEITFVPTSTYTTNCISMEVELEAVWDVAEVSTTGSFSNNYGVERMFYVIRSDDNSNITPNSKACTYTSIYPNGTTDESTPAQMNNRKYRRGGFTCSADSKFEYIYLDNNYSTLNASGKNLTIGRGVANHNGGSYVCAGNVVGVSSAPTNALNYTIRLESGVYSQFDLLINSNNATTFSSTVTARAVFGCDYDRASGNNNNLSVAPSGTVYGSNGQVYFSNSSNKNNLTYDFLIKSGKVQGNTNISDASADIAIYLGNSGNGNDNDGVKYMGKRRLIMEGGEVASIAGGLNAYGNNRNTYIVSDGPAVEIRIKGGKVRGSIYGAAAYASASGDRLFVFTGGTINGWVAGGANGTQTEGGVLYGTSHLYIGGNTSVNSNASESPINRAVGGNVFGAGCGYSTSSSSGQVTNGTHVVVADNAYIERGVYGGGSYGYCSTTQNANIYITGGHVGGKVGGVSGTSYSANISGGVFGGACQNKGGSSVIYMSDGHVEGGIYGGSNSSGTLSGNVTMQINGGQVGSSTTPANVHGGGYGQGTVVSGNVDVTLGTKTGEGDVTYTTSGDAVIYGDVYGGSALGKVNGTSGSSYHTNVTLNAGTIYGSLYGGGLGNGSTEANVYGPVAVNVYGGSVKKTSADGSGGVYGCNNINGAPQGDVSVDIFGTDPAPAEGEYALFSVYGGGNKANYNDSSAVTIHNCDNSIEYVYGGGNAAAVLGTNVTIYGGNKIGNVFGGGNGTVSAANVGDAGTFVMIYGGTIGNVFGGSNSRGTIEGGISVMVSPEAEDTYCPIHIDNLYGGGNKAASNAGILTIGCGSSSSYKFYIGNVYGGANQADITGDIELNINSGYIDNVFGGNNTSGSISGTITVNVEESEPSCGMEVGNVYGGGNLAPYTAPEGDTGFPKVNIIKGTVTHDVFGGGKGDGTEKGKVTGNPQVSMTGGHIQGNVYGGGSSAPVEGSTSITITGPSTVDQNVYGGGLGGVVTGNTSVQLGE